MDAYFILQSSGLNHFQRSSIHFNEAISSLAVGNSSCCFLKSKCVLVQRFIFALAVGSEFLFNNLKVYVL